MKTIERGNDYVVLNNLINLLELKAGTTYIVTLKTVVMCVVFAGANKSERLWFAKVYTPTDRTYYDERERALIDRNTFFTTQENLNEICNN